MPTTDIKVNDNVTFSIDPLEDTVNIGVKDGDNCTMSIEDARLLVIELGKTLALHWVISCQP